ncbi:GvpL/GvpF family gas vesicle protein [Streptomyces sp. NPDC050560]|uniref:GvpL/GvpF family gas vesicle protein n=1 Tax=Streptomyces sp. NPDC050560 TaxID=3365630 RepID=UPI0037B26DD8
MTAETVSPRQDTATVSYAYGICRASAPAPPPTVPGDPRGPALRLVRQGDVAAVVASVPAREFESGALEGRLNDLEELAALARAHHAVVDALHARATVLPLRLATVYHDDARVAEALRDGAEDFGRLLDWLDGHEELGVKVYTAPQDGEAPAADPPDPAGPRESPGRAYLRKRQELRRGRRDADRAAGAVAARLPSAVAGLARGRAVHRPQSGALASGPGENVANEAYLVDRRALGAFRDAVAGLAEGARGVRVEVTGPWAPYSFTAPEGTEGP